MPYDSLIPFLRGGKTAKDLEGVDPSFADALSRLISSAPENVRGGLGINSAFRSNDRQQQLFNDAVAKYGSEEAARKWVAPPGRSKHNHGEAMDLAFGNDEARSWVHANAKNYGLNFPMKHEPWHVEPAGARTGINSPFAPTKENALALEANAPSAPEAPAEAPLAEEPVDNTISTILTALATQAAKPQQVAANVPTRTGPRTTPFDNIQPLLMSPGGPRRESPRGGPRIIT